MHRFLLALTLTAVLLYAQNASTSVSNQQDVNKLLQDIKIDIIQIKENITDINGSITKILYNIDNVNKSIADLRMAIDRINNTMQYIRRDVEQIKARDLSTELGDLRNRIQNVDNNIARIDSLVGDLRLWVFIAVALAAISAVASIAALAASLRRRQLPQDVCA